MPSTVERLLAKNGGFSALPMTAVRLLGLTVQEGVGPEEIAIVLEGDPALCADALRLANGSASAPIEPIVSVREACHRLGPRAISLLAANVAAFAAFRPIGSARPAEVDFLWRHSLLTAVSSAAFAEQAGLSPERAHVAGLIQNISFLSVAQGARDVGIRIALAVRQGIAPIDAERKELDGETHGSLSARLLAEWDLPTELLALVRAHTEDDFEPYSEAMAYADVLRRGDALASIILRETATEVTSPWWTAQLFPELAAEVEAMEELRHEVGFRALEVLAMLG